MLRNRRQSLRLLMTAPLFMMTAGLANAETTLPVYSENGIAIDGTDPVAYFAENKPIAGDPDITFDWNGATWRFANPENRIAFMKNPAAFAPQYGGYCAYAVSKNYTAPTVPSAWMIVDGKLYLNFSRRVQRIWDKDIPGRIATANRNWPSVLN